MTTRREFIKDLALVALAPRLLFAADDPWQTVMPSILNRIKAPRFPNRTFHVKPKADGIQNAIDQCSQAGGGKVIVPAGTYLTGPIHLKSNVNLEVSEGATIKFSRNPKDYLPVVFSRWEGVELYNYSPFIYAFGQQNIAVTGKGTLDGQSDNEHWWPWKGRRSDRTALFEMAEKGVPVRNRIFG